MPNAIETKKMTRNLEALGFPPNKIPAIMLMTKIDMSLTIILVLKKLPHPAVPTILLSHDKIAGIAI